MDSYLLLKFAHITGFISLGGGLLAVFISELRAYRTTNVTAFAEAAWYTATFYDALVVPGAVLVGASGLFLVFELGLGFLSEPWLAGVAQCDRATGPMFSELSWGRWPRLQF